MNLLGRIATELAVMAAVTLGKKILEEILEEELNGETA